MTNPNEYVEKITTGLKSLGKSIDDLTAEDLSAVDQFHVRGLEAIEDLHAHRP